MQLNKVLKGLIIALPVMTMMACSSNSGVQEQADTNADAAAQSSSQSQDSGVQVGAIEKTMSPEEQLREDKNMLMQQEQVVYFDFDRATLRSDAYSILDKHAAFLVKHHNVNVVIEGHCDERGTPEYNISLGESRAKSVATYLQNAGVSPSQISVVSYGEEKPVNPAHTEAAFAENRRGVLVYQN
ncbi:peptidoglycan-associated lipoprotein Pal [Neptunicella marina]|uniref:Peptidoglycan-associated lipoprotein n=1 Tax=Neptunicella marina TaxID=2125989 RepID=A0A8J6ILI6_9ALTE|nr:peptidoglycan-associated lipoprotein Pal [Neptunicella marina]MBC3764710.1 peptidoglycan-associated lipoprotein Pal [Neptunicella marina]